MMRRLATAFPILLLLLAGNAAAEEPAPSSADAQAIRQVIEGQLAAFQRDDGAAAFAYASPDVQTKFHDPDTFMQMVKSGYRPVYRPQEVEFRDLVLHEGTPIQEVLVVGPDGQPVLAIYFMEQQPDGSWRISGCTLVQAPDQSV